MHQYLFFIGDFPVRAYGLVLSLSIVLGTGVAYFLARQDGRWHSHIVDMGIYCGLMGILGARLWDVFFLIGTTTITTYQKFSTYGKEEWPYKEVLFLVRSRE